MQKNTSKCQAKQKVGRRRQCCLRRTRRRWRRRRRSQTRHGARDAAGDVGVDPDGTWARGSARVLGVYGQDGTERRRQVGHNVDGGGELRAAALPLSPERDVGGFTLPAVEPTLAGSVLVGFPVRLDAEHDGREEHALAVVLGATLALAGIWCGAPPEQSRSESLGQGHCRHRSINVPDPRFEPMLVLFAWLGRFHWGMKDCSGIPRGHVGGRILVAFRGRVLDVKSQT
ncbi:hypothetical protein B0T24DRAFT_607774 [Lasiosphaeria ovina]|uniref:Uncharacterized protein n=1 Tax=Lasiosphaeria ovina TaxID=92902 RepID=A0AAE0NML1_9PEZI|nr:hypothetical protein B0T24DRAFT_607774 [Lasiosphaeria ovina]